MWIKKHYLNKETENQKEVNLNNFRLLENKVARLKGIIRILQSIDCTVNSTLKEKLNALEPLLGHYSVHMLCEALNVSRGTFYNHVLRNKRDKTYYSKRRENLRIKIREVYDDSNQIFGAGKITAVMNTKGYRVSEKMVRNLMHDMSITSIRQSAKALYVKDSKKFKNYLNQQFHTDKPNQVWVSDITYFKYENKSYYIYVILDLFSRMVAGYKIGKTNSTQLVKLTFKQAYKNRQPNADLTFHTDRGSNYRSKAICDYLKSLHVTQSFSRAYVPCDNSVMESYFASMKREELYRTKYRFEKDFRDAVDQYIMFYNTKRPHYKLQYKTPEQAESEYLRKIAI